MALLLGPRAVEDLVGWDVTRKVEEKEGASDDGRATSSISRGWDVLGMVEGKHGANGVLSDPWGALRASLVSLRILKATDGGGRGLHSSTAQAQPEPFLSLKSSPKRLNTPSTTRRIPLNTLLNPHCPIKRAYFELRGGRV
jgi:hypothetical protein